MSPIRTRVKFCGMTRREDIETAVACGVDAIGLILVPQSARAVSIEAAAALRSTLPPLVTSVILLRNAEVDFVHAAIETIRPDLLQFHGEESAAFCRQFRLPYLKSVAMAGETRSLSIIADEYPDAAALLLDGHAPGMLGGQGQAFDWTQASQGLARPLMLAGGLSAANVETAVRMVRPYAVDVSSGIESDSRGAPGIKDSGKMRDFAAAVRRADAAFR